MIEVDASCGILNKELVYVLENNTSSKEIYLRKKCIYLYDNY
jgi:hypothetical protein